MSDTPDSEGPAQAAETGQFAAGAIRPMEPHPRTVVLRRDDTGNYQILMGSRVIQGFCQEFEDVTGFHMGIDLQQRVRIHIEPIGRRQQARYPDREPEQDDPPRGPQVRIRHRDPGEAVMTRATDQGIEQEEVSLFSEAHPGNPTVTQTWQDEARVHLVEQITMMQQMIDLLARM